MPAVAVYCGSRSGHHPSYCEAAAIIGKTLVEQHLHLVYGGGQVGLMGIVADNVLAHGGKAIGVIPQFMQSREVIHQQLTHCYLVQSMQERKSLMAHLAAGFIVLPGGFGTLDELAEILTFSQLALPILHQKPIGILNWRGYYDGLLAQFHHELAEGFLPNNQLDRLIISTQPTDLVQKVAQCIAETPYEPPSISAG